MSYRVYTTEYDVSLNGIVTRAENLAINDNQRSFKINSVFWDFTLTDVTAGVNLPLENNIDILHWFRIGEASISPVGNPFQVVSGAYTINGGYYFRLYRPGQLKFDSFFMTNFLQFRLLATNVNAAKNYSISGSIVVEITDEIIF